MRWNASRCNASDVEERGASLVTLPADELSRVLLDVRVARRSSVTSLDRRLVGDDDDDGGDVDDGDVDD